MNPIETLWAILKRRLSIKDITSKQDLVNSILNICSRNTEAREEIELTCQRLIHGMPARVERLYQARGGHTKHCMIMYCVFQNRPYSKAFLSVFCNFPLYTNEIHTLVSIPIDIRCYGTYELKHLPRYSNFQLESINLNSTVVYWFQLAVISLILQILT